MALLSHKLRTDKPQSYTQRAGDSEKKIPTQLSLKATLGRLYSNITKKICTHLLTLDEECVNIHTPNNSNKGL